MKWLVLIALLVLLVLALFRPNQGLAASDAPPLAQGSHEGGNADDPTPYKVMPY